MSLRVRLAAAISLALLVALLLSGCGNESADAKIWKPNPSISSWQWQLQGKVDTGVKAPVYEVDGFDVGRETVNRLHSKGRRVICYLDVGSWERYRSDAKRFPKSVIGKKYEGYPDESWLDIRRIKKLAAPLRARFRICASKGFDAVEPDNVNGWENPTGFPLTRADQLRFNRWIAREVHKKGMSVALKNDGPQATQLVGNFDFAVVEQCFQYDECGQYTPFIRAGKAVFESEYELAPSAFCPRAKNLRFTAIRKSYDLFAKPWRPCR